MKSLEKICSFLKLKAQQSKSNGRKRIIIDVWDQEDTFEDLLNKIKANGNGGHSFEIIVDPDDKEAKEVFFWDGDGSDTIGKIDVQGITQDEYKK